jgi:hypothetical protein
VGYESEPDTRLDDSFSHQGTPEKYAVGTGTEGAVTFSGNQAGGRLVVGLVAALAHLVVVNRINEQKATKDAKNSNAKTRAKWVEFSSARVLRVQVITMSVRSENHGFGFSGSLSSLTSAACRSP